MLNLNPRSIGFVGSDTYNELTDKYMGKMFFAALLETKFRMALAAPAERANEIFLRLWGGNPIAVATSYPNQLAQAFGTRGWNVNTVLIKRGSIESTPKTLPQIDAVFDLVDTGNTLADNGLEIIADQLGAVSLGGLWLKEGE